MPLSTKQTTEAEAGKKPGRSQIDDIHVGFYELSILWFWEEKVAEFPHRSVQHKMKEVFHLFVLFKKMFGL
jgi:hypothetical protein